MSLSCRWQQFRYFAEVCECDIQLNCKYVQCSSRMPGTYRKWKHDGMRWVCVVCLRRSGISVGQIDRAQLGLNPNQTSLRSIHRTRNQLGMFQRVMVCNWNIDIRCGIVLKQWTWLTCAERGGYARVSLTSSPRPTMSCFGFHTCKNETILRGNSLCVLSQIGF